MTYETACQKCGAPVTYAPDGEPFFDDGPVRARISPCGMCTAEIATLKHHVGKLQAANQRLKEEVDRLYKSREMLVDYFQENYPTAISSFIRNKGK